MSPQMSDMPTWVGPKQISNGRWLCGGKFYHLVLRAQQETWAYSEDLPLDTSLQDFMGLGFFRTSLSYVLAAATSNNVHITDNFSDEDIMAFFFWIDHPGYAADFLVMKTGADVIDPGMFAGESTEADGPASTQVSS